MCYHIIICDVLCENKFEYAFILGCKTKQGLWLFNKKLLMEMEVGIWLSG